MVDASAVKVEENRIFALQDGQRGKGPGERQRATEAGQSEDAGTGSSALLAAANPLLNLVYQIRTLAHVEDPAGLKAHLVERIHRFERRARYQGVSQEHVLAARYCLCTVLDETAAQTPWGGSGVWSNDSLLVRFHNEAWGGEKFFQLLARLTQSPRQHIDMIELMYNCLCLGFEGRYRVVSDGKSQLEAVRLRVADIISSVHGVPERALSPHWQGVSVPAPKLWNIVPVWVSAVLVGLAGLGIYALLSFWLAGTSDKAFLAIGQLEFPQLATAPSEPRRFSRFLAPEIRQGLVAVREYPHQSIVTLQGDGLFASGSVEIRPQYLGTLERVAAAIATATGNVQVIGYTDNVPIHTLRFPSNWELSRARARSVAEFLRPRIPASSQIDAVGRGASDPIADNASAAGRATNRRVDIVVLASPDELRTAVQP